jgi:hypothetical protein
MFITLIILRKRWLPKMLVFGVFLILLSVCNSHPQNANGYPPLDAEDDNKLNLFENERIKREINQGDNSTSNSESSSSSPNSLATNSQQPSHLSITTQTAISDNSEQQGNSNVTINSLTTDTAR